MQTSELCLRNSGEKNKWSMGFHQRQTDLLRIEPQLLSFLGKRPGRPYTYTPALSSRAFFNVDAPCLDSAPSASGIHKSDIHELTLQDPAAVFSDQHHVLPADPAPFREVQGGLHRHDHSGLQRVLLRPLRLGPRGFQSDAMPEPMRKGFGNAERLEVPSGRLIHITGQNTGMDSPDSPVLRFLYGLPVFLNRSVGFSPTQKVLV